MSNRNKRFLEMDFRESFKNSLQYRALESTKNTFKMVAVLAAATILSLCFRLFGFNESNFILTYILAVFFVANLTPGYLYGILSSIIGVLAFNFFFTEPYYSLSVYRPDYPVTFLIMLIVALITSTITAREKRESLRAELREKRMRILYQIERNLLAAQNASQIAEAAAKDIFDLFGMPVIVCLKNMQAESDIRHVEGKEAFNSEADWEALGETMHSGNPSGSGTPLFPELTAYFFPILGKDEVFGAVGIEFCEKTHLSENQRMFLDTIGSQIALALDRERLYEKQQEAKTEVERERLRGNLLRAVSHDLRTPLTGILGSASIILNNYNFLSDDVKKEFIAGITEDAEWLSNMVDNILNMTRFDEGTIQLKKEMELVEEIVSGAVMRVKGRAGLHEIRIRIPEQMVMVKVDGMLIEQALINLLDNAIKHTPDSTEICLAVKQEADSISFEVSDNGPGIPEGELPLIFNRFYRSNKAYANKRGIGLGLTISKTIVEAHGGKISAANKPSGGAVFRFVLPMQRSGI